MPLTAPFPYFGGKSTVAHIVWTRFGNVGHYVEPFFGSGAVLLARPHRHSNAIETVNDASGLVVNFWRAVAADPAGVAAAADRPLFQADLIAISRHCSAIETPLIDALKADPDYFDATIAGRWAWGLSSSIGDSFTNTPNPALALTTMYGVNADGRRDQLTAIMKQLQHRMRRVRVLCGSWGRLMSPALSDARRMSVGVFLDPPYSATDRSDVYRKYEDFSVAHDVRCWALENGENPALRIALCGYDDVDDLPGWTLVQWRAHGGLGNQGQGQGRANAHRECIWFSPHCLHTGQQLTLLDSAQAVGDV